MADRVYVKVFCARHRDFFRTMEGSVGEREKLCTPCAIRLAEKRSFNEVLDMASGRDSGIISDESVTSSEVLDHSSLNSRFSMTVSSQDGSVLLRLFENDEGLLDAEWGDPSRRTEAAERFIAGMTNLWNFLVPFGHV